MKGSVITARTGWRDLCPPPLSECEATLMGIRNAYALRLKELVVGDFMVVLNALNKDMEDYSSEIRPHNLDCKSCFENFNVIKLQHVCRNKNNVVHVVAKHGVSCKSGFNWSVDHEAMNCNQEI